MNVLDERKQKTQRDYSVINALYRDDFGKDFAHFELIDSVLRTIKQNQLDHLPIVDLGCGPGTVTDYLVEKGIENSIAVDITPEFCEMVRSAHPSVKVICADMVDYLHTAPNSSIGAYIANFSIIHVPGEELDVVFQDVQQSLVGGGFFVMSCHKGTYKGMEVDPYVTQKDKRLRTTEELSTYMNYFTEEELKNRLVKVGLRIVEIQTFVQEIAPGEIDVPKIWVVAKK
jgi:SAM-dependent methyltransferase